MASPGPPDTVIEPPTEPIEASPSSAVATAGTGVVGDRPCRLPAEGEGEGAARCLDQEVLDLIRVGRAFRDDV